MSNIIRFPIKETQPRKDPLQEAREQETRRRIEATKSTAREAWFVIFWPFGVIGLFLGWKGFLLGSLIGFVAYLLVLNEMRYGKEL